WKRAPRFDAASGLTRLETVRISKASANQRSGRAGRLGPGVCYRLWHRGVEQGLQSFDRPEIVQADLAPLVLELALWGENDPTRLRWLNPPGATQMQQAKHLLMDLEAMDANGRITELGREMAGLPLHPRLSHMLLKAQGKHNRSLACSIAALVSERDILRGTAGSADLEDRLYALSRFKRYGNKMTNINLPACHQVDRVRQQLARQVGKPSGIKKDEPLSAGALLSLAYPDRIAALRPGSSLSYRLTSGRGAVLPGHDRLQSTPFLTIASMDGRRAEGRIYLAASLTKKELQTLHRHRIVREETVRFDPDSRAVRGSIVTRIGKMEISRRPLNKPDPLLVQEALLSAIHQGGLNTLPWSKQATNLVRRIRLLMTLENQQSWPDFSDQALLDTLEEWLGPCLNGITTMAGLQRLDLAKILPGRLDWQQQQQLKRDAPTHLQVPSGSRIPLQYQEDGPPVLAVRLQEMFGLTTTPTICRGRIRVLLHLLSPARRPMQITDDLKGFWENSYHEVRKELKGRYPKHYWPDDPKNAQATVRVKRKKN
ncbi:MAG TPA: ATP-dependent helicase HrpB, partial [Desulfobulbaceae bacterium]|nr:ATP-dependent helicase HrpB [Desulfobulbaceae bacterium]